MLLIRRKYNFFNKINSHALKNFLQNDTKMKLLQRLKVELKISENFVN